MKLIKPINFKSIIEHVKNEGITMQRRFTVYIISTMAMVISLILLLLNVFGVINPTNFRIIEEMDTQLSSFSERIEHDYNKTAAYALSYADQLESNIQSFLAESNMTFDELKNNPDALSALQSGLYDTVYLNLQLTPSSGIFYILDTTVNSDTTTDHYNGIYLKYVNIYSESTLNNDISLYRGSYRTGKDSKLTFHSGWRNELRTDFFDTSYSEFSDSTHYILSETVTIPDTWERARYVYVPLKDSKDNIIGVCGFEINDLYFQLTKKAGESQTDQMICALLDKKPGYFSGQFNSSRYNTDNFKTLEVNEKKNLTEFDFTSEKCIGKCNEIKLGNDTFTVALMISEAQYNRIIRDGQLKIAGAILIVVLFTLVCCIVMSKKYVSPILKKLEKIKAKDSSDDSLKIREIDDLFAFLAERDNVYEDKLKLLEKSKSAAEEEALRTRIAYEKALEKFELAQNEIDQLSKDRKQEIVLEDYEYFICNLKTLTATEYRIYELYLEGRSASEIGKALGITSNTIKYHNKNIYSKLGISSRKQLIKYASVKQLRDQKNTAEPVKEQ